MSTIFRLSENKHDRVLVATVHTNDFQFVELQTNLLEKHLKFQYDFAVGFDSPEVEAYKLSAADTKSEIAQFTKNRSLTFVEIPREAHHARDKYFSNSDVSRKYSPLDPAIRCADSVQYMLSVLPWQKYQAILLIDADMFPIADITHVPVSFETPFYGIHQKRSYKAQYIEYLWNGIFWISGDAPFQHLINFDLISKKKLRTDVGGQTHLWINRLEDLGRQGKWMPHLASGTWTREDAEDLSLGEPLRSWLESDYRNESGTRYFSELYDGKFLHYRAGSNWQRRDPSVDNENRISLIRAIC